MALQRILHNMLDEEARSQHYDLLHPSYEQASLS
jgi:hypothetical protein